MKKQCFQEFNELALLPSKRKSRVNKINCKEMKKRGIEEEKE